MERPEHPVAVRVKIPAIRLDQTTKRVLVATADRVEQPLLPWGQACRTGGHYP